MQSESDVRAFCHAAKEAVGPDIMLRTRLQNALEHHLKTSGLARVPAHLWMDPSIIADSNNPLLPDNWLAHWFNMQGQPISANRNDQVRHFLKCPDWAGAVEGEETQMVDTDYDAVLLIDRDIVPTKDNLRAICDALDNDEVDAVSGVYCMDRPEGPVPILYYLDDGPHGRHAGPEVLGALSKGELLFGAERFGVPAGFLAVKRHVFEAMLAADMVWFKDKLSDGSIEAYEMEHALRVAEEKGLEHFHAHMKAMYEARKAEDYGNWWRVGDWKLGEDIWFCRRMLALGFNLYIHLGVQLRHYHDTDLTRSWRATNAHGRSGFDRGLEWVQSHLDEAQAEDLTKKRVFSDDPFDRMMLARAQAAAEAHQKQREAAEEGPKLEVAKR